MWKFLAAASAFVLAAAGARALAAPDARGVVLASGSSIRTEIGTADAAEDVDDYVVHIVRGQQLQAVVKPLDRHLVADVALLRGDGTPLGNADGASIVARGGVTTVLYFADATDSYVVRVRGAIGTDGVTRTRGRYAMTARTAGPRPGYRTRVAPDMTQRIRGVIPARGGARLSLTLRFRGTAPTLVSLVDPAGDAVPGFAAALQTSRRALTVKGFTLPPSARFGEYVVTFAVDAAAPPTGVTLEFGVAAPLGERPRKGALARGEPYLASALPAAGTGGSVVTLRGGNFHDPGVRRIAPRIHVGAYALTGVAYPDPADTTRLAGTVPDGLPLGHYDVIVETETGQIATLPGGYEIVPPPTVASIDPASGPADGGFELTITGTGFRPGKTAVRVDFATAPAQVLETTATTIRFFAPPHAAGLAPFGVVDLDSALVADLAAAAFRYGPALVAVEPGLTPVLGGETITLRGAGYSAGMRVFLETSARGTFEAIVPSGIIGSDALTFVTPIRAKGAYELYLLDVDTAGALPTQRRTLTYFTFADLSPALGLTATAEEGFDAWTSAIADFDGDGAADLFLSRRGGATLAASPETRVFRNDGTGRLADVTSGTSSVMPAPTADDDWRADRLAVTDVTADGRPDVVLGTNGTSFPSASRSHVRILVNEKRDADGADTDRVFRDRTADVMAPPRVAGPPGGATTVADSWRALDLWIGDLDASGGVPEILITHTETKEELDVGCGTYCASPFGGGYAYGFYWGGTRAFRWDPDARGGLGRFKFDHAFFPRSSGLRANIFGAPPGTGVPVCNSNYGYTCRGKFPPMLGERVTAGRLDGGDELDVAVVTTGDVAFSGQAVPSLQVVLNRPLAGSGSKTTPLYPSPFFLGDGFKADCVAIGSTGFPDGNAFGVVAMTQRVPDAGTGSLLRVFRYVPGALATDLGTLPEITSSVVPAVTSAERWQASEMRFLDADQDGDQDLVLVANSAVGAGSALRVLRNVTSPSGERGHFNASLQPLLDALAASASGLTGDCLAIGDLDGDGEEDVVVTRATPGATAATHAVRRDR